ncbi:MAG: two-component sensor histidine kinase [Chromatiaceae bacterium]|nr:two-component sensor histidine kinase [Chromatiaceae bacterium]
MDAEPTRARGRLPPPWLGHLLVFGLLFALVLGWFFWQTRQAQQLFEADAGEHARLLTDAVTLHARGALLAEELIEALLTRTLGNSARFVDYLDGVAPFADDELAAFAAEAGLAVIRIQRADTQVQGPRDWDAGRALGCETLEHLVRLPERQAILFGIVRTQGEGCVLVGLDSGQTQPLEEAIRLSRALDAIAALPGVRAVRLDGAARLGLASPTPAELPRIQIREATDGTLVAEASATVAGASLRLELDAGPLQRMRERLWWEFLGFILVLIGAGGAGAWILYRHQRAHERQRLDYERRLSRQREEAALGRAAASIAHEIRNPLNAMAMGLQRLHWEADELSDAHRRLLDLVQQALRRTNGTVGSLLDYARPIRPKLAPVALARLVAEQLELYAAAFSAAGWRLDTDLQDDAWVAADPDLLRQVLDNLLRNVIETEPHAGMLEVRVQRRADSVELSLTNDGVRIAPDALEPLLEPWFTTKTQGTGLGLAISQRMIAAHGGTLSLSLPRPNHLRVSLRLPALSPVRTKR